MSGDVYASDDLPPVVETVLDALLAARQEGWQQGWREALAADPDGDLAYIAERLRETYNEEGAYIVMQNLVRAREGRLS